MWRLPPPNALSPAALKLRAQTTINSRGRTELDRLSRLITLNTGLRLRQHVLWNRLLCVLSSNAAYSNISVAAFGGGFADHAHLTRTFRAFLGRVPSEFRAPPDALERW